MRFKGELVDVSEGESQGCVALRIRFSSGRRAIMRPARSGQSEGCHEVPRVQKIWL